MKSSVTDMSRRRRRLTAFALALVMLITCCSCSLKREYITITDHSEVYTDYADSDVFTIRSYTGLKNAIWYMVTERMEHMVLRLYNFSDNVDSQIHDACIEVQTATPIGAYAVDYFVAPASKYIVSYYEAEIYINYRRTEEQMSHLTRISNMWTARSMVEDCFADRGDYLALWLSSYTMDEDFLAQVFSEYYYKNPFYGLTVPNITINRYPDEGSERILELMLDYKYAGEEYDAVQNEVTSAIVELLDGTDVAAGNPAALALSFCSLLSERAAYDAIGARNYDLDLGRDDRFTMYGVLCGDSAVGEGYAVAYDFLCRMASIPCDIVVGTIGGVPHAWNRITLGGEAVNIDCAMYDYMSDPGFFNMSESFMDSYNYIETASY